MWDEVTEFINIVYSLIIIDKIKFFAVEQFLWLLTISIMTLDYFNLFYWSSVKIF